MKVVDIIGLVFTNYFRARASVPQAKDWNLVLNRFAAALCLVPQLAWSETLPDCGLYLYSAKVVRVIDGDTIVADVDLGFNVWRHSEHLRLLGIQTPESDEAGFDEASDALAARVLGREVYICTAKAKRSDMELRGGFGRYLATIYADGVNINDWLLKEGFAVEYE